MSFATVNPSTGEVEQTFAGHSPEEVERRLARGAATFGEFSRTTFADRARLMITAAELLEGEVPEVAHMLTTEMGKTFAAAKGEVAKCALALRWFADHAEVLLADEVIETSASSSLVRYQPLGMVLAVMPWNFPLWQVVRFAAPALMVGNVGLLKHASNVPRTALFLEDLFRRAGYPEGAFTTLMIGSGEVAGVIADERVAAVTLTGSERAGQSVAAAAGQVLKKCVLELGGSDPFVVTASADLDQAVLTAARARTQNNGQSCIAAKRFIVEASVYDEFTPRFVAEMAGLVVGDPFDPATDVGPLVSEAQRFEVAAQVDDARSKGAVVACGGEVPAGPGWYYPPTVLLGMTPEMRAYEEEVFGPVAVVERADDLDHAIALANRTAYGLGSSVWSTDPATQRRCIDEIEAGQVFVNAMVVSTPEMPFGGIKRSGYGRELSSLGIKEFCNAKTVWVVWSVVGPAPAGPPLTYLDHAATSPMRPAVIEAMAPFAAARFGNASGSHRLARDARTALEEAREQVAEALGAAPAEVVFTSGGTESDNLAVLGALAAAAERTDSPCDLVCSAVEHSAVLAPARAAERWSARRGAVVRAVLAPVDADGCVEPDGLAEMVGEDTAVVSVMAANNEVGTIQPLGAVVDVVRRLAPRAVVHTDAVQAAAWLDVAALATGCDLVSVSAHKLGGPKGVGALVVRRGTDLVPLLFGGGQEQERRSGTHDVAGAVGLAAALAEVGANRRAESVRVGTLRSRLADGLLGAVADATESASREKVLPGHCHLRFAGIEQEELLVLLDAEGVCASGGAACASGALDPSHVLAAMGVGPAAARWAIRFTLGHTTDAADVERALAVVPTAVASLRAGCRTGV